MKTLARLGLAVVLYAGAIGASRAWEARHTPTEYLAVPPSGTLRVLGAGYDNMIADGLYLQFVNYFGKHLVRDRSYHNLMPALLTMTDIDPRFKAPYRLGALALGDADEFEALDQLMARSVARFPNDWEIAFDAGMAVFIFAKSTAQYERAATYFLEATRRPGAEPKASFMLARAYHVADRRDLVVAIWRDLYARSPNKETRLVAERSLARLGEKPISSTK